MVFLEDDHPPSEKLSGESFASTVWFSTRDAWHDEMFFRRNFAQVLSHGQQLWWFSLGGEKYKDPHRQKIVGALHRIGRQALDRNRGSVAEVAVVIDERSVSTMRCNPALHQMLLTESHGEFFQTGAPFECFELQSFLRDTDPLPFKVIAFLNLFRVDSEILAAMNKLKSNGRTLLFSFAPGLLNDDQRTRTVSTKSASGLVGMALAEESTSTPLTVWVDPERVSLLPNGDDVRYGWVHTDVAVKPPVIGIVDPDAESLGFLRSGTTGFGRKAYPDWTSVFSAAPCLPSKILRELFRDAGVHLYTEDGDVIYANQSMIACSASSSGTKQLTLPRSTRLVDALDETLLELDAQHRVHFPMKRHETRIFWQITD